MNQKFILSIILIIIVIYLICDHINIEFKEIILYSSIVFILYIIYNSYYKIDLDQNENLKCPTNEKQNKPNNDILIDTHEEILNNQKKNDKHVTFNDIVDTILFDDENKVNTGFHNKNDKIIDINTISNNSLSNNSLSNDGLSKQINILSTDREKMFIELEAEINNQYIKLNIDNFNDIEIPMMNNLIPNSSTVKNSDINPVINPDTYKVIPDENLTIWEQYDKATTNNYKQFNSLENLENNYISDAFLLGNNREYGNTSFDTYSLM